MVKKILAVVLAFALAFAFAACGKDDATDATTAATTADAFGDLFDDAATTEAVTEVEVVTDAQGEAVTAEGGEVVTEAVVVTEPPMTNAAGEVIVKPESKEAIVEYFNTAINNAKTNSKSITSNYMVHSVAGEILNVPRWLEAVIPGTATDFVAGFMGEDDSKKNVTWSSAEQKNEFFPVEKETYASKLTADDVKEAKLAEKDGNWIIRITTIADAKSSNIKHGQGHAPKAFNVVTPDTINDNLPGFLSAFGVGTAEMNYPSSTVTVTVDPETGNVIHASYMMYWTINLPVNDVVVVLPFSTENDYTINW